MQKILTLVAIVGLVGVFIYGLVNWRAQPALGSVNQGGEYQSTSTAAVGFSGNQPFFKFASATGGNCVLGSVTLTSTSTGSLIIYDATTTVNGAVYGTTTLAAFANLATAGTYTFDVVARYGLTATTTGSIASSTITYRCN